MSITTTNGIPGYLATATVPALTTIYTPVPSCSNRWVASGLGNFAWSTYSREGYADVFDPLYYDCLPSSLKGPQYSPGVCTSGQTIASITKYIESGSRTMWQAQCCKSGMTVSPYIIQNTRVTLCMSSFSSLSVNVLFTSDQSTQSSTSTLSSGTAIADPVYVAWEAADLAQFPVAYASSLAQRISVPFTPTATPSSSSSQGSSQSSVAPASSSSSSSPPSDAPPSNGLSTGAKIGIGVGAGVGSLLIAALIAMIFIIRRLRARQSSPHPGQQQQQYADYYTQQPEMIVPQNGASGAGTGKWKWGFRSSANAGTVPAHREAVSEIDSHPVRLGDGGIAELDGSGVGSEGMRRGV